MASVEVHKTNDILNADVALAVVVQLSIAEALVLQALRIGAPVHLLLPVLMSFCK